MKLKKVKLTKHETCKTYAFKRIGLKLERYYSSAASILEDKRFKIVKEAKKGDILYWSDGSNEGSYIQNEITSKGKVLTNYEYSTGHVAVFEGCGICSDAHLSDSYDWTVRCRPYSKLTKPNYILRLIDQ